jgi:hypothetical protein
MVDKLDLLPHNQWMKVYDYDSAIKHIEEGKDPEGKRPLYERGLYAFRLENDRVSIAPYWSKDNPLVIYEPNGIVIIPPVHQFLRASLRRVITNYANLNELIYRKKTLLISTAASAKTQLKERRCANCSGQKKHTWLCTGQDGWHNVTGSNGKTFQVYLDCTKQGETRTVPHREQLDCHRCSGTGKVPWGGKFIPSEWDITKPLRLNIVTGEMSQEEPIEG